VGRKVPLLDAGARGPKFTQAALGVRIETWSPWAEVVRFSVRQAWLTGVFSSTGLRSLQRLHSKNGSLTVPDGDTTRLVYWTVSLGPASAGTVRTPMIRSLVISEAG
jgi:hypothetical protein